MARNQKIHLQLESNDKLCALSFLLYIMTMVFTKIYVFSLYQIYVHLETVQIITIYYKKNTSTNQHTLPFTCEKTFVVEM